MKLQPTQRRAIQMPIELRPRVATTESNTLHAAVPSAKL